jgi:hypothetical protein
LKPFLPAPRRSNHAELRDPAFRDGPPRDAGLVLPVVLPTAEHHRPETRYRGKAPPCVILTFEVHMAPAAFVLLGLVGIGVAAASRRDVAAEQRKAQARAIRQAADRRLLRKLFAISQDEWAHPATRRVAWSGASLFKKYWLDAGWSGARMPSEFSVQLYGNWCGPGWGGGHCVDSIDCACRTHDLAYDRAAAIEEGLI